MRLELPRSKLTGYQKIAMRIYPKGVTPKCFNRGSTVLLTMTLSHVEWVGGPVPNPSVVSSVEPPLKACGNDGQIGDLLNAASGGESNP